MLKATERNEGGRPLEKTGTDEVPVFTPKLADLKLTKKLSSLAQKLAAIATHERAQKGGKAGGRHHPKVSLGTDVAAKLKPKAEKSRTKAAKQDRLSATSSPKRSKKSDRANKSAVKAAKQAGVSDGRGDCSGRCREPRSGGRAPRVFFRCSKELELPWQPPISGNCWPSIPRWSWVG